MSSTALVLQSAAVHCCSPLNCFKKSTLVSSSSLSTCNNNFDNIGYGYAASVSVTAVRRMSLICCEVASATSTTVAAGEEEAEMEKRIGARVRVKVPLKVYHVPKVAELDLEGKEGQLKQYVAVWKGKRISANLPFKVQFILDVQDRGAVKFFAHLKEDEFEFLD